MSERKQELFRAALMIVVVWAEWQAMQPYREPVLARFWDWLARVSRAVAARAGRLAITAENNYYRAAEAGI